MCKETAASSDQFANRAAMDSVNKEYTNQTQLKDAACSVSLREQLEQKKRRLVRELTMIDSILRDLTPEVEKMLRIQERLEVLEKIKHGLLY